MSDHRQAVENQYAVMAYRVAIDSTGMGAGDVVALPIGWLPLNARREGETVLVLCYQQLQTPGTAITLTSLEPDTLPAGTTPATVDVYGTGFDSTCTIMADNIARPTFYLDGTHLQYTARPDLASPGDSHQMTVQNGAGDESNGLTFTFT